MDDDPWAQVVLAACWVAFSRRHGLVSVAEGSLFDHLLRAGTDRAVRLGRAAALHLTLLSGVVYLVWRAVVG